MPVPKVSVLILPWQLFQCQQSQPQERLSQKCLCPLCRVAGVSSSVPETNVPVPKVSVPSVRWQLFQCQQSKRRERLSQQMSVPTVPLRWCLYQVCQRQVFQLCRVSGVCIQCASAKCANCAVSVATQAIEPIMSVSTVVAATMSVPSVPCRQCLFLGSDWLNCLGRH